MPLSKCVENSLVIIDANKKANRLPGNERGEPYRYLKIHHFLRKRRHLVVEAKPVLANTLSCEHEVTLSLLGTLHNDFLARADNRVIHIEGTTGLNLMRRQLVNSTIPQVAYGFYRPGGRELKIIKKSSELLAIIANSPRNRKPPWNSLVRPGRRSMPSRWLPGCRLMQSR